MTVTATLADGRVLNFPAGTDPAVVQATVKKLIQEEQQAQQPAAPQVAPQEQQQGGVIGDYSAGDIAAAPIETIASAFTGALGEIVGGIGGVFSMPFVGADKAGDVVNKISDTLQYEPRSKLVQDTQQKMGEALAPVGDWISKKPAEMAYNLAKTPEFKMAAISTGNPLMLAASENPAIAGAAGATAIPAMLELLGVKGASKIKTKAQAKKVIADQIANGDLDMSNITYTLNQSGDLITNPKTKQLQKLFPDERAGTQAALTFEQLNPADRRQVIKMIDTVQKGRSKGRAYVMENRPADIIGEGISGRVQRLIRLRKNAGENMKNSLGEMSMQKVDLAPEANNFINQLDDMGIGITRSDDGLYKVDMSQSTISLGDGVKKSTIEQILNNLDKAEFNGAQAHRIKKLAQETVDYQPSFAGKRSSVELENAVKELARGINENLRPLNKNYAKANDVYSSVSDVLGEAQKRLGGIDLESELADKRFGNLAKRIASNFTSRDDIIALVDGLDGALAQNGINMKSNIKMQVAALAELEELFKLEKNQSPFGFQGRIETAVQGMSDPNMGAIKGLDAAINKLRQMRQPDFDARVKAVKQMLEEKQ